MAKTQFLDWSTTASSNTDVDGIGILGSDAVNHFDDALRTIMAQLRAGVDGEVVYAAKSANYTAVANDNNAFHRYTATATVSLTAAATLGNSWHYAVSAVGASTVVTIDPNASETIGGVTTLIIRGGQTAFIICDGTNFQVEIRGTAYATQSGNYTALLGDKGTDQRFTAAATLSLTAAATLGAGWKMSVIADGGAVTIDPNASETINGLTTLIVPNGATAEIICDGSNFFTVVKPAVWELIGDYTLSAASSLDVTGLSAFRKLEISGSIRPSSASALTLLTSTNNGSSYDAGASDYNYQYLTAQNTTVGGAAANSTAVQLSATASVNTTDSEALNFVASVENFNKAIYANFDIRANAVNGSGAYVTHVGARRLQTTGRNAFRIIAASGTLTGTVTVKGLRG